MPPLDRLSPAGARPAPRRRNRRAPLPRRLRRRAPSGSLARRRNGRASDTRAQSPSARSARCPRRRAPPKRAALSRNIRARSYIRPARGTSSRCCCTEKRASASNVRHRCARSSPGLRDSSAGARRRLRRCPACARRRSRENPRARYGPCRGLAGTAALRAPAGATSCRRGRVRADSGWRRAARDRRELSRQRRAWRARRRTVVASLAPARSASAARAARPHW